MDRTSISNRFILIAAVLLLSGALSAQNGASRQPLPAFKYRADNNADTARQYKVAPNRENRAVSVCAVWNMTDTAERTLWSMADSIVLFDLMERAWLVRPTNITNCRTQISVAADSLPQTDSLYLLVDHSGKGVFDGAECHGPARADSSGLFTFMLCWDNDNSGTDLFTFARAGLPERLMSATPNDSGEGNPGAATGIRNAESAKTAIWPNPVLETLHVQAGIAAPLEALVTDSHGKLLLRQRFAQSDFELNVSGLASGSYTLLLRSNEGSQSIPFVVKRNQ